MPDRVTDSANSHPSIVSYQLLTPHDTKVPHLDVLDFVTSTLPRFPNPEPRWATVEGPDADDDLDGGCRAGIGLDNWCQ